MSADDVKFRKPVVPGDMLLIEAELVRAKGTASEKPVAGVWSTER